MVAADKAVAVDSVPAEMADIVSEIINPKLISIKSRFIRDFFLITIR
jgi:hypothetical protein